MNNFTLKDNSLSYNYQKENEIKYFKRLYDYLKKINFDVIEFGEEFEYSYENVFDYDYNNGQFRVITNNIGGTISFENKQINITSRFGNNFLKYMIASSEGFLEFEKLGGIEKNNLALWILIYYWKLKLKKAFFLGLYKIYTKKKEQLGKIKGNINFSKIYKFKYSSKVECIFKEHSYSNYINLKIKEALDKTFSLYPDLVNDIGDIKRIFNDIKFNNIDKNNKILNPYYLAYKEVFDLSLKILNNESGSFNKDNNNALLFDFSLLFEHHIRKLLIFNKFSLGEKNKKEFTIPNGIGESNIYPDIIIYNNDNSISIYDVKYKRFDERFGVKREDRFQIVSYVSILSSKYKIKESGIIYPDICSNNKNQELKICNLNIPFRVLFYPITKKEFEKETDFNKFAKEQINNDKKFINYFKNY
jgi:5-methylcytosine-specific restriction enzyme subunit McrC